MELVVGGKSVVVEDVRWYLFEGLDSSKIVFSVDLIDWNLLKIKNGQCLRFRYGDNFWGEVIELGFKFRGKFNELVEGDFITVEVTVSDYESGQGVDLCKVFDNIIIFKL